MLRTFHVVYSHFGASAPLPGAPASVVTGAVIVASNRLSIAATAIVSARCSSLNRLCSVMSVSPFRRPLGDGRSHLRHSSLSLPIDAHPVAGIGEADSQRPGGAANRGA